MADEQIPTSATNAETAPAVPPSAERRVRQQPELIHVASLVFNTPLAIDAAKLETILHGLGDRLVAHPAFLQDFLDARRSEPGRSALNAYWDDEDDDSPSSTTQKRPYELQNGVAIIPVSGTLMDTGGWMSALSGCSSYEGITKALRMAMDEDSSVRAVLFKVNSPGGSTNGCFELCDLIHSYRGQKPMYAVAKHMAASAAYAIASSADKLFVTLTGSVGSVGVYALHCDQSGLDTQIGVKYKYIKFGARKTDGNSHEPLSTRAETDLQAEVDRQGNMFVSRIARNRGVSTKKIIDTQAGVFCGEEALPLLADAVGTYDDALAELSRKVLDGNATIVPTTRSAAAAASTSAAAQVNAAQEATVIDANTTDKPNPAANAASVEDLPAVDAALTSAKKMKSCAKCSGSGQMDDQECTHCSGKGEVEDIGDEPDPDDPNEEKEASVVTAPAPLSAETPAVPSSESSSSESSTKEKADMDNAKILEMQKEARDLCACASIDANMTLDYMSKIAAGSMTFDDVKKAVYAAKVAASTSNSLAPGFGAIGSSSSSSVGLARIATQFAAACETASPDIPRSSLLEKAVRANPSLYRAYRTDKALAALVPDSFNSEGYLRSLLPQYAALGLSTAPFEMPQA